jgi:hypothetical protein
LERYTEVSSGNISFPLTSNYPGVFYDYGTFSGGPGVLRFFPNLYGPEQPQPREQIDSIVEDSCDGNSEYKNSRDFLVVYLPTLLRFFRTF